jgi:hypothetical protein
MEDIVLDRERFQFIEHLCRGGQADIEIWSRDGVKVVGKVFKDPGRIDSDVFMREARILVDLKHPALLEGLGVSLPSIPRESAILWDQFAENGALDPAKLNPSLKCCAAARICKGVLLLHSKISSTAI